jgi:hypothetical protein
MKAEEAGHERKHAYINQETILFKSVEDYIEFEEMALKNQKFRLTDKKFICFLPAATDVVIHDEVHTGCVKIEVDLSLFKSRQWSNSVNFEELDSGYVCGVVGNFAVSRSCPNNWRDD